MDTVVEKILLGVLEISFRIKNTLCSWPTFSGSCFAKYSKILDNVCWNYIF